MVIAQLNPTTEFPAEVEMILSAMNAAGNRRGVQTRSHVRLEYRAVATLRLFSDTPEIGPRTLYTRDISPRSMGFVTQQRLPLGYGGVLAITDPEGNPMDIACTLLRCREASPGWYEGAVYFNRIQPRFTP